MVQTGYGNYNLVSSHFLVMFMSSRLLDDEGRSDSFTKVFNYVKDILVSLTTHNFVYIY